MDTFPHISTGGVVFGVAIGPTEKAYLHTRYHVHVTQYGTKRVRKKSHLDIPIKSPPDGPSHTCPDVKTASQIPYYTEALCTPNWKHLIPKKGKTRANLLQRKKK